MGRAATESLRFHGKTGDGHSNMDPDDYEALMRVQRAAGQRAGEMDEVRRERDNLLSILREVYDDLATASETWRDSDAGPLTVPGEPRAAESLDVTAETQGRIRAALAKANHD